MSTTFQRFKALHHSAELFVLPNIWDAHSAMIAEKEKFPAVATSSAAVAESLGYEDGEQMPLSDYLFVIKRILSSIHAPLTVDMEMGYGKTKEEIAANFLGLAELGVAGINIEDSMMINSSRSLKEAAGFAKMIEYLKGKLQSQKAELFINLRCDTYLMDVENKEKETITRLKVYENSGADSIFLPCISKEDDIAAAIANTQLPVGVMCIPGLPDFNTLSKLGVKRASMGPFLFRKVYSNITTLLKGIGHKSFAPLLS